MVEGTGQQIMDMSFILKDLFHLYVFLLKLFVRAWLWPLYRSLPGYSKERLHLLKTKFNSGPVAHRGGVPENTIEAFQISKHHGVQVVEVDLSFTKDNNPVMLHDIVVDRTSNGTGAIKDMTLEEARALDVGAKYNCPGARIPTLHEAIASAKQLGLFVMLDIKDSDDITVKTICELFKSDSSLYDCVSVSSFYPDVIYKLRCCDPKILCGLACSSTEFSNYANKQPYFGSSRIKQKLAEITSHTFHWLLINWAAKVIKPSFFLPIKYDVIDGRFNSKRFLNEGLSVIVWTVNTKDECNYFQSQYNLPIMTDKVADLYS